MRLEDFITNLVELEQETEGNEDCEVYMVHGASGVSYKLGSCFLRKDWIGTEETKNWIEITGD